MRSAAPSIARSRLPSSRLTIDTLLGGKNVLRTKPRTMLDWIAVIRRGIAVTALETLTKTLGLTQSELAGALGISERTLARRKREGILNGEESAKLVRLARVVTRAEEVFEE